jgi:small nuclear ribonucleoprotein (snRNP)-like protein
MGHDIADINNDGLPDIYTLDMLPDDNQRLKQMYAGSRFSNNSDNRKYGYHDQYKRNVLQLNNGPDDYGNHLFSEIGLFANAYATDWSWSALLADFDNDGFRDLFISNGYPRDVTDLDYATTGSRRGMRMSMEEELENIPERHFPNYLFRNTGKYAFADKSAEWGFDLPSYSNGAAYADLDNDGDLDIVTNNINEPASIYENRLYADGNSFSSHHYLRIKLNSDLQSGIGLGYIVTAYVDGQSIYTDHSVYHGFLSTVDPMIHIGLGTAEEVDSLIISRPDGRIFTKYNIRGDQIIEISDEQFSDLPNPDYNSSGSDLKKLAFNPIQNDIGINYFHEEDPFNDFNFQPTLPYQLSQSGPAISVADLDGNGEFDFYIGGSKKYQGSFYFQQDGRFQSEQLIDDNAIWSEDQGTLLFDIEGDGDIDLLVVSGSVEQEMKSLSYRDRIYLNNGDGKFTPSNNTLPGHVNPGTCIKGADIDQDGDIDLFIGGGPYPGHYPNSAPSHILRNDSEPNKPVFTDITSTYCPMLQEVGLVKDALWTDFNNDTKMDLILVAEWMPITVLENQGDQLVDITLRTGIENHSGWWNSLAGGDFDNDGDIDYLAGNHGLNSFYKANTDEPLTAYASDFDNNGRTDIVLAGFAKDIDGSRKVFPVHFRNDLNKQIDLMRKRFPSFKSYSEATIDSMFSRDELQDAKKLMVNYLESSYIENLGNGKFRMIPLPLKTQFAPVFGMLTGDFNHDQFLDVLVVGNFFGNNPFWGKMDALNGLLLLGKGNGQFDVLEYAKSGFLVPGDAKAIVDMPLSNGEQLILVSQNQDSLKAFTSKYRRDIIELDNNDIYADIKFEDGSIRKQEFYYGNTYLSQTQRIFRLPEKVKTYEIYNSIK